MGGRPIIKEPNQQAKHNDAERINVGIRLFIDMSSSTRHSPFLPKMEKGHPPASHLTFKKKGKKKEKKNLQYYTFTFPFELHPTIID